MFQLCRASFCPGSIQGWVIEQIRGCGRLLGDDYVGRDLVLGTQVDSPFPPLFVGDLQILIRKLCFSGRPYCDEQNANLFLQGTYFASVEVYNLPSNDAQNSCLSANSAPYFENDIIAGIVDQPMDQYCSYVWKFANFTISDVSDRPNYYRFSRVSAMFLGLTVLVRNKSPDRDKITILSRVVALYDHWQVGRAKGDPMTRRDSQPGAMRRGVAPIIDQALPEVLELQGLELHIVD